MTVVDNDFEHFLTKSQTVTEIRIYPFKLFILASIHTILNAPSSFHSYVLYKNRNNTELVCIRHCMRFCTIMFS